MLTVKHIGIGGNEMMVSAQRVWFYPGPPDVPRGCGGGITVVPPSLEGPHDDIHGGTVFVMNEGGKTIARYDLGASPVPMSDDELAAANAAQAAAVASAAA